MSLKEDKKSELNNIYELRSSSFVNKYQGELHKSKREGKLTLTSIIYKKFGKGENKKKRYEKITNEIKKIENNSKKELLKLSNQIINIGKKLEEEKEKYDNQNNNNKEEFKIKFQDKLLNLQNKKLILMELERDKSYNYFETIQKLKIPPNHRTVRDAIRIKNYLLQSKLGANINNEFPDKNLVEKILNFCSIEMHHRQFKKGEIIVKIGERLDSFYSIIIGKISIMKPFMKKEKLTGFEYFKYLMELKRNNESYIINQCIKNNEQNYIIETNHLDLIQYIYLLNYLEYIHLNKKPANELDEILHIINLNPLDFNIDPNKFNSKNYKHDYLKVIKKRLPNISHILFDQYSFLNDISNKKEMIIYEYKKIATLRANDFFGDSVIENREPINDTYIAEEDCDMAVLPNKLYYEQIASEKTILLDKKISDLHENHFFRQIKYGKFSKKYFKLFINEKYNKGDIIFNEGDEIKYLYFIQEGTVELSLSKSINEIDFIIDILLDKEDIILEKNKEEINLKDLTEDNYTYEEYQSKQKNNNNNSNNIQLPNSNEEIDINYLNQKQNNKLIILKSNEDIGLISLILGNNYISTCTVTSKIANIYKLDKNNLRVILSHESECKEEFFERLKNKIDLIKERLSIISNIKLVMQGKKEIKEKKSIEEKEIKKSNILKVSNINALIDYDKINNILENKPDDNNNYNYIKLNSSTLQNKSKIENVNLPLLNSYKKMNSKVINISNDKNNLNNNSNEEDSNELSKSKIMELMKKGLMFNLNESKKKKIIINQKHKIESAKKLKYEDKMIYRIQKEIDNFSKNKFNLSRDKSPKNKNNNIMSYTSKNSEKIYLTSLNILNNIKPFSETEREKITYKTNKSDYLIKKENIAFPVRLNTLEKILPYHGKNKNRKEDNKIKSNYIRFNTEENLKIDKNKINHVYKNPLTLIKQEKYKIFEKKALSNKFDIDYLAESLEKMKELKKIYSNMKQNSSPKYRNKFLK